MSISRVIRKTYPFHGKMNVTGQAAQNIEIQAVFTQHPLQTRKNLVQMSNLKLVEE
ncbi:MAG: hypothetical protein IPJ00_19365 [Saprospirales bacterium]|nr:hypothetical protein [Saprospirales bacterium]